MPTPLPQDLSTTQRRDAILEQLQRQGVVRVRDLAKHFAVSTVTVRADLAAMEEEGLLRREHGGAVRTLPGRTLLTSLSGMEERQGLNSTQKRAIAAAAARHVRPRDIILIDAGTTAVEMVPFLTEVDDITIVTNALNVAAAVGAHLRCRLILLGGTYSRTSSSTLGPQALHALSEFNISRLFLGTQAFDAASGLTDTTTEIAQMKRAMIDASREVYLLADSSKWEKAGFIKVAPLNKVHHVLSDSALPAAAIRAIKEAGPRCEIV